MQEWGEFDAIDSRS